MSESKIEAQTPEAAEQTLAARKTKPLRRLYAGIAAGMLLLIMLGAVLAHRRDGKSAEAQDAGQPAAKLSDVIEPTPDQMAQLQVESVREEVMDVDLSTTGKVGFNEDRLTPVFTNGFHLKLRHLIRCRF